VFTTACLLSLSSARWIQSTQLQPIYILIENQQMHQMTTLLWCPVKCSYMFQRTNTIIRELIWSSQATYMSVCITRRISKIKIDKSSPPSPQTPMPPHVPYGLCGLPSQLLLKCNWLLRLGRPRGAVTLSRWGGWWYMNMSTRRGLKPKVY
jgi:hypothetical protein